MKTYDEEALEQAIELLKAGPQTVGALAMTFQRADRTIKRWLEELGKRGHWVVRDGTTAASPYRILPGGPTGAQIDTKPAA